MVTELRRRLHGPQGQPEEHQGLGRPGEAGDVEVHRRRTRSPRAAPSGTSWPPTAPSSSRASREEEAQRVPRASCSRTSPCRTRARARRCRRSSSGKGDVLLAYENEAIRAQQKGEELDYVVPDQTILIENPVAVTTEADEPGRRAGVRRLPLHARGAEDLRRARATARSSTARRETRTSSRRRPACSRSTKFGGWDEGQRRVLRPREGHRRRDRARAGSATDELAHERRRCRAARRERGAGVASGDGLGRGIVDGVPQHHRRCIPLAAVVVDVVRGRVGAFWDAVTSPQAVAALQAHADRAR